MVLTMRMLLLVLSVAGAACLASALAAVDPTRLPLGDGKYTTAGAKRGWIYACGARGGGPGAQVAGPWITGSTWSSRQKISVGGAVRWMSTISFRSSRAKLQVTGNGLPKHTTGIFPIRADAPAYRYDRNPNAIREHGLVYSLPATPKVAPRPACLGAGAIGVMLTGSVLYDGLDAQGRDAKAHELQDTCDGHPQRSGQYHYHSLSACADAGSSARAHSKLVGYARDGFGIFGLRGVGGKLLSNADLDACHGHTHAITWRGKRVRMFHYHATLEYPYTLGCFRGTAVLGRAPAG